MKNKKLKKSNKKRTLRLYGSLYRWGPTFYRLECPIPSFPPSGEELSSKFEPSTLRI